MSQTWLLLEAMLPAPTLNLRGTSEPPWSFHLSRESFPWILGIGQFRAEGGHLLVAAQGAHVESAGIWEPKQSRESCGLHPGKADP